MTENKMNYETMKRLNKPKNTFWAVCLKSTKKMSSKNENMIII